jgi:starvation-inducible DNA-binding protein
VHADLIAALIAVLGDMAQGTVRTAATQSTLPEYPGDITESDIHVQTLGERVAHHARMLRIDITHAADVEDAGTANVYIDISRGIDQRLSCLEAHFHK